MRYAVFGFQRPDRLVGPPHILQEGHPFTVGPRACGSMTHFLRQGGASHATPNVMPPFPFGFGGRFRYGDRCPLIEQSMPFGI